MYAMIFKAQNIFDRFLIIIYKLLIILWLKLLKDDLQTVMNSAYLKLVYSYALYAWLLSYD